jgi:hypothetical protein
MTLFRVVEDVRNRHSLNVGSQVMEELLQDERVHHRPATFDVCRLLDLYMYSVRPSFPEVSDPLFAGLATLPPSLNAVFHNIVLHEQLEITLSHRELKFGTHAQALHDSLFLSRT